MIILNLTKKIIGVVKEISILLAIVFWCFLAFAQKKDVEAEANQYYKIGDYYSALNLYQQLYYQDTTNARIALRVGICKFYLKQHPESCLTYIDKAAKNKIIEAYYYLGKVYHLQEKFDEAINAYNYYLNSSGNHPFTEGIVQREIELINYAKQAVKNPVASTIENLGPMINSEYSEYAPLLTADENTLYFTSRRAETTGNLKDELGNFFEDVYVSKRINNSQWSETKNVGPPINTNTNDACTGLSPDGHTLLIYRTQPNKYDGDLYISYLDEQGWSEPQKLNNNINSPYVETSACISLDNQVIYFSSNRPGGQGGKDIYLARMLPNGEWGKPINLGPAINTPFDEDAPYIHPDGRTLYFSSKGHNTIGGYDVYVSKLDDNDYWSTPVNLGYPINTTDDDIFFVLSADEQRGYIAGRRPNSYGAYDIYKINFKGVEKNLDVLTGTINQADNPKNIVVARITLIDEDNKTISGIYQNNSRSGKFVLLFNPNKHYKLIVEAEGFNPLVTSLNSLIDIQKFDTSQQLQLMLSKKN
jgi:tetratricopeptide (TPR) repeat protein